MSPVFAHGQLRLYLLVLLAEAPRHGYEVIQDLETRFGGLYTPSAGTVYPRLAKLEEEGLVERTDEGRKATYRITGARRGARPSSGGGRPPSRPRPIGASPRRAGPSHRPGSLGRSAGGVESGCARSANDGASGRIDLGDGLATGIEPGMGPVAHGPKGRRGSVWRDGRQVRLTV